MTTVTHRRRECARRASARCPVPRTLERDANGPEHVETRSRTATVDGGEVSDAGARPRLQIECEASRDVSGGFDSRPSPPTRRRTPDRPRLVRPCARVRSTSRAVDPVPLFRLLPAALRLHLRRPHSVARHPLHRVGPAPSCYRESAISNRDPGRSIRPDGYRQPARRGPPGGLLDGCDARSAR